jgi:hypothetical protein
MVATKRAWYTTPAFVESKRLDGPFEAYDDCQAACLKRVDRATAARMLVQGKMPAYYVPRMFVVTETEHLFSEPEWGGPPVRLRPTRRDVKLPSVIYTYSKSALLILVVALQLDTPQGIDAGDRAAILRYIERELSLLATGRKVTFSGR